MTSHNKTSEKELWQAVKAKLIARFGTVKKAAAIVKCHPNALRYTASGKCPRVAKRLDEKLNPKKEAAHAA